MTFRQWMTQYKKDDTARGDLARDLFADRHFSWRWSTSSERLFLSYLHAMNACRDAVETARAAYADWRDGGRYGSPWADAPKSANPPTGKPD